MLITGEGNGNPLQYSCLENSVDRGACWATVHGVTKGGTRLNDWAQHMLITYIVRLYHIVCPSPRVYLSVWRCYSSWTVNILYVLCILEKEMVPHSIILVWRIPWTEETCGLPSMGLQRVRHDWANNTKVYIIHMHTHANTHARTCAHTLLNSEFFFLFFPQTAVSRRASTVLLFWLWTLAVMKLLCCV